MSATYSTYENQLAVVVAAIVNNGVEAGKASDASKERKGTLATALRDYATTTEDDGVSVEDGRKFLRIAMIAADLKMGTVKGYGASYNGFRAMLADGAAIDKATVKEAQDYVASDAVKELNAAKKVLREALKPIKSASELLDIAEFAKTFHKADDKTPAVTLVPDAAPARTGTDG